MWGVVRWFIFPTQTLPRAPEPGERPGRERWWLETEAGQVEAWFLPGDKVSADQPGPAVVFAHGNGELIDPWEWRLAPYREMGVSVLLLEYRGYGRSAGRPSQRAIVRDAEQFYQKLCGRAEVDQERIFFQGHSLGGGVVCALSRICAPKAMILQSTFTSIAAMTQPFWVPQWFILDPFDNLHAVVHFQGPVLVVHGTRDKVVPYRHGQRLQEAAPLGRLVTYDCGHNDFRLERKDFWAEVASFLTEAHLL